MPRFKLRTLLVVLAVGPPVLAWYGWPTILRFMEPKPMQTPPLRFPVVPSILNSVPVGPPEWDTLELRLPKDPPIDDPA